MHPHRLVASITTGVAVVLALAVSADAQNPWTLTIRPSASPLLAGVCSPVRLDLLDAAGRDAPRNPLGVRVSMADFDMTVKGAGVVGRYDGASAWSACACPTSAGAVATITATYPARALAEKARVPGVAFQSSITVPVAAGTSSSMPIGCEAIKTTTVAAGREVVPWTVTLTSPASALAIGSCTPVRIDLRDATGKEEPRSPAGMRVSIADFDMTIAAASGSLVVGQGDGTPNWSACGCQGSVTGAPTTITATYPSRALAAGARVPGVALQASITMPLAAALGTSNPAACSTSRAPVSGVPVSATTPPPVPLAAQPAGARGAGATAPLLGPPPAAPAVAGPPSTARTAGALGTAPAPTGVTVTGTPASASLVWQPVAGVASYVVMRGQANVPPVQQTLASTNTGMSDSGLQPATTYTYTIRAIQPDGREGSAEVSFTTPPVVNPSGFTAKQSGDGQVQLSWQPVSGASYYVVFGPGSAFGGVKVTGATSYAVSGVPAGTQEWAVASYHEPGPVSSPGTAFSRVTLAVTAPAGRYLITVTGLRAIKASYDDQLSRDGMGDEVYAAVFIRRYDRRTGAVAEFTSRRTSTYGDTRFFSTRVQAGTWSATGGIRDTDPIPANSDPTKRLSPPSDTRFPFKLWEGTLTDGVDALVFSPSLWEEDGMTTLYSLWNQQMAAIAAPLFASPEVQNHIANKQFGPLFVGTALIEEGPTVTAQAAPPAAPPPQPTPSGAPQGALSAAAQAAAAAAASAASSVGAAVSTVARAAARAAMAASAAVAQAVKGIFQGGMDRPIGILPSGPTELALPNATVVLTREIIEAGLAPLPPGTVPIALPAGWPRMPSPGVIMVPFMDGNHYVAGAPVAPARYELYVTVERLP